MAQKLAAETALQANKNHHYAVKVYAERLEEELKAADKLIAAVEATADSDDGIADTLGSLSVPGADKPVSLVLQSSLLDEASPFRQDAEWHSRYKGATTLNPMTVKDHQVLANAVRSENQRLHALEAQQRGEDPFAAVRGQPSNYFELNKEGIDWNRVSIAVSSLMPSGVKPTAKECEIRWLGHLHPDINREAWTPNETQRMREIIDSFGRATVNWQVVADRLGTKRSPIDCMRHGTSRRAHTWNAAADERLLNAVERFGLNNWALVARNVSEDATAHQCQKRYNDTVDPSIKRGPWSADEDASLLRAVEAFTAQPEGQAVAASAAAIPWEDIALFVSGRTKNQCRERYQDRLKPAEKKAKGRWAANEDALLRDAVAELGTGKWKDISDRVGNGRTDAMCRRRYELLLKKGKAGPASEEEDGDPSGSSETASDEEVERPPAKRRRKVTGKPSQAKGKEKAADAISIPANSASAPSSAPAQLPKPKPKPRPIPRRKMAETIDSQVHAGETVSVEAQAPRPAPTAAAASGVEPSSSSALTSGSEDGEGAASTTSRSTRRAAQVDEAPKGRGRNVKNADRIDHANPPQRGKRTGSRAKGGRRSARASPEKESRQNDDASAEEPSQWVPQTSEARDLKGKGKAKAKATGRAESAGTATQEGANDNMEGNGPARSETPAPHVEDSSGRRRSARLALPKK